MLDNFSTTNNVNIKIYNNDFEDNYLGISIGENYYDYINNNFSPTFNNLTRILSHNFNTEITNNNFYNNKLNAISVIINDFKSSEIIINDNLVDIPQNIVSSLEVEMTFARSSSSGIPVATNNIDESVLTVNNNIIKHAPLNGIAVYSTSNINISNNKISKVGNALILEEVFSSIPSEILNKGILTVTPRANETIIEIDNNIINESYKRGITTLNGSSTEFDISINNNTIGTVGDNAIQFGYSDDQSRDIIEISPQKSLPKGNLDIFENIINYNLNNAIYINDNYLLNNLSVIRNEIDYSFNADIYLYNVNNSLYNMESLINKNLFGNKGYKIITKSIDNND